MGQYEACPNLALTWSAVAGETGKASDDKFNSGVIKRPVRLSHAVTVFRKLLFIQLS